MFFLSLGMTTWDLACISLYYHHCISTMASESKLECLVFGGSLDFHISIDVV